MGHHIKLLCMKKSFIPILSILLGLAIILLSFFAVPIIKADATGTPTVELLPSEGPIGTLVYVRMSYFEASKPIIVIFGTGLVISTSTSVVARETTDSSGYAVASFVIDDCAGAKYYVTIDDGTNKVTTNFRVTPQISLTTHTGFVGDTVSVSGKGFAAKKPINAYLDDVKVANTDADDKGMLTDFTFKIPQIAKGDHTLKIQDSEGSYVTAVFTIKQKLSSYPEAAAVGTEITISGSGFPKKDLAISFDDQQIASAQVESNGNFTVKIPVPECTDGTHRIKVDDGTNKSICKLMVLPSMLMSPSNGHIGMSVGIKGTGFKAGFPVTITYDEMILEGTVTDAKGSFTHTIKVPKSRSGEHNITITEGANTQKAIFTVESTAPMSPMLSTPADSAKMDDKALHFEWGAVNDPSGVLYEFQIADDAQFSKILFSVQNLTQNTYDIPEDVDIQSKKTPYYWRVRAIDNASNIGQWSGVSSFFKSYTISSVITNMPGWTKYTLLALAAVLVVFSFFWVGRILRRNSEVDEYDMDEELAEDIQPDWSQQPAQLNEWDQP